jgi:hypothetical protein
VSPQCTDEPARRPNPLAAASWAGRLALLLVFHMTPTGRCGVVSPGCSVVGCDAQALIVWPAGHGRPIGPWSRRTRAPWASVTERDRSPPVDVGHTRSQQVGSIAGTKRSPRELRTRRSDRQRSRHQAPFKRRARVRVSQPAAASPPGSWPRRLRHRGQASPSG